MAHVAQQGIFKGSCCCGKSSAACSSSSVNCMIKWCFQKSSEERARCLMRGLEWIWWRLIESRCYPTKIWWNVHHSQMLLVLDLCCCFHNICFYFLNIYFIWLCWVLAVAHRIFDLCCGMQDLVPWPGIKSRHGELRVLATAPPGEVPRLALFEVWLADSDLQEDTDLE